MRDFVFDSASEADTLLFGKKLQAMIPDGTVVALNGVLGAGKTALVRAFAAAGGENPEDVTSPTFVMIQEYTAGRRPVYHFDVYRIKDDDEFLELGPEEYFDSQGVTFVEWANRVEGCLPPQYVEITVTHIDEHSRRFEVHDPCGLLIDENCESCEI